ncbi:MAG: Crp/Fnr family transcriptional regulator [Pelosinus sp.]|nr:Crp/Fnr family transcriptional regulator [Pelosinus sp.]
MTDAEYLLSFLQEKKVPTITKKRHKYLAYQGCEQTCTYVLAEGVVKTSVILRTGREFNIAYLKAPDIISLLRDEVSHNPPAPFNIRVETQSATFYQVERVVFWKYINQNARLQSYVKDYYRRKLIESIYQQQLMTTNGKRGAVCGFLTTLIDNFGTDTPDGILLNLSVTNEDIAGFCGISTRNSVNRIMHDLKDQGILDIRHKRILIRDLSRLTDLIGE